MLKTIFLTLVFLAVSQNAFCQIVEKIPLSLEEAKSIALESNRDIQIERQNVEISEGEILVQQGLFDPLLNLNLSYTDSESPTASTFISSGSLREKDFSIGASTRGTAITGVGRVTGTQAVDQNGLTGTLPTGTFYNLFNFSLSRTTTSSPVETLSPSWFTNLGFTVGQDLIRNFGLDANLAQLRVARRSTDIAGEVLEQRISEVLLNVETSYWNLVAAKQNLELAETALDLAMDLQKRNEIQVEVGTLAPVSVTQAKSEVAAREVDVIRAENELSATEDGLLNILALPLISDIQPTDQPTTAIKQFDPEETLAEALEERPELKQAELDIANKEDMKKFFSNQKLPRLAVQGTVNLQGLGGDENPNRVSFGDEPAQPISSQFNQQSDAFRNLYEANFPAWQVLAIFSYPIFNWEARGNYVQASADLDRSVIAFARTKDNVSLDVRNGIREVENSLRRIEAARTAVGLAEEVLGNEEERLKVGIGTTRDVLEAQRDLVNEKTQLIRAIADYNIALAELERAKGTLIEASGMEFNDNR